MTYFKNPEQAVDAISTMLSSEAWEKLSRYYDLSDTDIDRASLISGEFFVRKERPELAHPAGFCGPGRAMGNETTIQTVTGAIAPADLGRTLAHEHMLIGWPGWESDTLRRGPTRADAVAICSERIAQMQAYGVRSMIDPCPNDLGRNVELMAEVAARTGFQVICATGLYKEDQGPKTSAMTRRPTWTMAMRPPWSTTSTRMTTPTSNSAFPTSGPAALGWART